MDTGQHGTITNKAGVKIPVTMMRVHGRCFEAEIDGADMYNIFYTRDWEFEADKPALPTRRGSVVRVSDSDRYSALWLRTGLLWVSEGAVKLTPTEFEAFLKDNGHTFEDVTPE